ncbi:hypothetical protein C4901_13195 [Acidiferrobacter sp. SPIII_3]|uniref:PulJ/GspJ family protein n=1 Tax=Acidiferrobacter sp. SPIII_3 TaxID=1281578 RepID=UPI000D73BA32|nr:prepilin-type N-terminal cleavage/methylation domain-containing protein [Acidiferrobacter sp. SPIII_3]AWP24161.1 hypothetical protein C4901_13195 [Acidiferrobacter sp. SPIII_3]
MPHTEHGFTLLEVVVAMAIFVTGAATMLDESSLLLRQMSRAHRALQTSLALQDAMVMTTATARARGSLATPLVFGPITVSRHDGPSFLLLGSRKRRPIEEIILKAPRRRALNLWVQR